MRHIEIVGVDTESETVECQIRDTDERLVLPLDAKLRAAARGVFPPPADESPQISEKAVLEPTDAVSSSISTSTQDEASSPDNEDNNRAAGRIPAAEKLSLRPREIQDRVRMGATVDELVELTGMPHTRVEAFAYPILQERAARAEKARGAHPMLGDGPAVETVEDATLAALDARGIEPEVVRWDSWRLKSGSWVLQASWPAGLSEDASARWEYVPDSHGGIAHPLDEEALAIGDPSLRRPLAPVHSAGPAGPVRYAPGLGGQPLPHDPTRGAAPYVLGRPVNIHHPAVEASAAHTAHPQRPPQQQRPHVNAWANQQSHAEPMRPHSQPAESPEGSPQSGMGPSRPAPISMHPGTGSTAPAQPSHGTQGADHRPAQAAQPHSPAAEAGEQHPASDEDFLLHPPTDPPAAKGRGKHPTMPSWEDVLLGVRPKD